MFKLSDKTFLMCYYVLINRKEVFMDNNTMVVEEAATEKQKKKINWKKVLESSLPALISIAICFFAMIFTGAYPFGKQIVGYIDVNDGLTPAYTYLWDILHGKANIFVAWDLGAGGSAISSLVLNGFLSPISWLIAIFPRASVMYGIAFLVIVKLALMATTAYICFKKFFPKVFGYRCSRKFKLVIAFYVHFGIFFVYAFK